MTESGRESSITEGGLVRPMVRLAWPIVVIQLLQVAYNLADTFWLGRYSGNALAAISLAFPLILFLISVSGGFTTAGSILVAQYTGADSEGSAGKVAGQTLSVVAMIAVVLGLLGFFLADPMLSLLPADPETQAVVIPLAVEYMRWFFLGVPALFGFFVFTALMRGYGNTRVPMRVMLVSVAINVVIDPVLIFGYGPIPELGIRGAVLATVFSRFVAAVIGVYILFYTDSGPDVSLPDLRPEPGLVKKIVRLGLPSAAEQSTSSLAMITLTAMVASFPPGVVGAYGLGNRLISLVFLPAMGLGRATNTMVGQNLGAGEPGRAERAVRLAVGAGAGVMLCVGVIAYLFPGPIVSVFLGENVENTADIAAYSTEYVRIRTVEFAFIGILQVLLGAFRGSGNTTTSMVFSMVALWIGRVPTVYVLAFVVGLGAQGIWYGMALGNIVGAIAAGAWFLRGTWKNAVIDEEPSVNSSET